MSLPGPSCSWLGRVERRVARWAVPGSSWVVAVSGGGDSVALVRVLHALAPEIKLRLSLAHLDHGTRGEASRADAAFVTELAEGLGLPLDLGHWRPTRPGHFESDARRARYAWLSEAARHRGASAVAVGHTRDDQAETILHRVVRGTDIHGLSGIPARRALGPALTLVRPLLSVSRDELRHYLTALGQPYCEDATNADLTRTRARLRHDLMPRLAADYNPRVADALVRLAQHADAAMRDNRRRLQNIGRRSIWSLAENAVLIQREGVLQLPISLRAEALRLAWRSAGWPEGGMNATRWWRLARWVQRGGPGRFDIGGGISAEVRPDVVVLSRPGVSDVTSAPPGPQPITIPGECAWRGGRVVATLAPEMPRDETIDLDPVCPPLCVRAPRPGDRFEPLGLSGHGQPLNDFLRARRVPPARRVWTPLVCDRVGIIWVVGHRIADRVRLTANTTRPAGLRWDQGG